MIVLLPQPLAPTRAVTLFAGMFKLIPFKTCTEGLAGYAKLTSFTSSSPAIGLSRTLSDVFEEISGIRSFISMNSLAAPAALAKSAKAGEMVVNADVPIMTEKSTLKI